MGWFRSTDPENKVEGEEDVKQTLLTKQEKARWNTIRIMYFITFILQINMTIVLSSLWPFLQKINPRTSATFYGWTVSGYCIAELLFSIIYGHWRDYRRPIEPLVFSIFVLGAGNILYAYSEPVGLAGIWVACAGRLVQGCAGGVTSVTRATVAQLSSKHELSKTMSHFAVFEDLGLVVGPAIQAAFKPFGTDGVYIPATKLYINVYTAPCYFMVLLSVVTIVLLFIFYDDTVEVSSPDEERKEIDDCHTPPAPVDKCAVTVMLAMEYINTSVESLTETLLTPFLMNIFAFSHEDTVFYGAVMLFSVGVFAIPCCLCVTPLTNRFPEHLIMMGGFLMLLVSFILYLPWGPGKLQLSNSFSFAANETRDSGCRTEWEWCHETPKLPFPQFLTAIAIETMGFTFTAVVIYVLYSKIIGPRSKGTYMGWITGAGALARIIAPLYATFIFVRLGIRGMAIFQILIVLLAIVIVFIKRSRLVPYDEHAYSYIPLKQGLK